MITYNIVSHKTTFKCRYPAIRILYTVQKCIIKFIIYCDVYVANLQYQVSSTMIEEDYYTIRILLMKKIQYMIIIHGLDVFV